MATVTITENNFEEITNDGIVLVDWWAGWCGPCRMFGPIYEEASGRHPSVVFGKIDTESEQGLAADFGVRSIPTLMAFREGVLVFAQPGLVPGHVLDKLIDEVGKLDMAAVRREIEAAEAKDEDAEATDEAG